MMQEFFAMGGYALWVWSAFGLTVVILIANIIAAGRRYRQAVERLQVRLTAPSRRSEK